MLTPDSFVRAALPGMNNVTAIVHTAAAMGARFTQYTAEFEPGGCLGDAAGQRFLFVIEGEISVAWDGEEHRLTANGYAYFPAGAMHHVTAAGNSRAAVIEKPYHSLDGVRPPETFFGDESTIPPTPLGGDEGLQVHTLLPAATSFDFAVNTMTYVPGATLPMVESHVMEHGLLMLEGGGIYRLGDQWYPVAAGDFIWMAPYCPQWFGALGKTPARYLIYKDWNR
ncbi:MAG TPA: (S)-ureidoglycine aminohydrolase [Bryobacteraceae bacterium]|nr:(S)-ureidoglycine aminohydrolase [Bryobacteraceae bacterium]